MMGTFSCSTNRTAFSTVLLHEFKLGPTATEATTNVNMAWGEDTASGRAVHRWFQKLGNEDDFLEDKKRAGRPSLVDHEVLTKAVVKERRRLSTDQTITAQPYWDQIHEMCAKLERATSTGESP
ncbi:hypothetical protein OSTOST_02276 [Ostertagia ostertagi]